MRPVNRVLLSFLAVVAVLAPGGAALAAGAPCERVYEWPANLQRDDGRWDTTINPVIFVCENGGSVRGVAFLSFDGRRGERARAHWLSASDALSEGWSLSKDGVVPLKADEVMNNAHVSFNPVDIGSPRDGEALIVLNRLWSRERARLKAARVERSYDFATPANAAEADQTPDRDLDAPLPSNIADRPIEPRFNNPE